MISLFSSLAAITNPVGDIVSLLLLPFVVFFSVKMGRYAWLLANYKFSLRYPTTLTTPNTLTSNKDKEKFNASWTSRERKTSSSEE